MGLTNAEIVRIKAELGFNVQTIGAIPYLSYLSLFDQVIQPYTQAGATTTSSTVVTAATAPTVVTLTLADPTGFTAKDRVIIDVDSFQEEATIRNLSGSHIDVALTLAHTGTYPIEVQGGVSIIRRWLRRLDELYQQFSTLALTAGMKRADEVEWYQATMSKVGGVSTGGSAQLAAIFAQRDAYRSELASAIGITSMWDMTRGGGATSCALY